MGIFLLGCNHQADNSDTETVKQILPPKFISPNQVSVSENQTEVMTVKTDSVQKVTYSLNIVDLDTFIIDKVTGDISFKIAADFEIRNEYSFSVIASDTDGNQSTKKIIVNILDVAEYHLIDEPYFYQQWYLNENAEFYSTNAIDSQAHINAKNLLKQYTGNKIKIAIIDDGLDVTHEELSDAITHTYDISTGNSNVAHTNQRDHHGTAITGIIAARLNGKGIKGIASNAEIVFLKYKAGMSDSETIDLFLKAEEFGAQIINCSWGTYDVSQAVKETIQNLAINGRDGKGIAIVFASGNDDLDMRNDESAIPEVISVGASSKYNLRAWYSNYGSQLDVIAPGGSDELGITTLDNMGVNGISSQDENYLLFDDVSPFIGTSAAAPIVSGVIALMLEKNPTLTRIEIENLLKNTSEKIGFHSYQDGRNDYYGYGKINLYKIMSSIDDIN